MAIGVIKLTLGSLSTNCFIPYDTNTKEALIIDPSDSGEFIARTILDRELQPIAIIATHGHFDHILAAEELKLTLNIPFLMSKKDVFLLSRMQASAIRFTGVGLDIPPKVNRFLKMRDKIKLGKSYFRVIETPGHTPGSISLYSPKNNLCFSGDLFFSDGGIGRYDFSYSDKSKLLKSINNILKLPGKTNIFCGHGGDTSISKVSLLLKNLNFV